MLMYFLLTLFDSLVTQAGGIPGWTDQTNPDLAEMLKYALSYATMAFLIWKIPNLASGFMNGQPALEGHDVINSTRSAIGTGATVASLAYGIFGWPGNASYWPKFARGWCKLSIGGWKSRC